VAPVASSRRISYLKIQDSPSIASRLPGTLPVVLLFRPMAGAGIVPRPFFDAAPLVGESGWSSYSLDREDSAMVWFGPFGWSNRCSKPMARRLYVLHEIVHNRHVVEDLRDRGAIFVESIKESSPVPL